MMLKLPFIAFLIVLISVLLTPVTADARDTEKFRLIVHLLDYIAKDYGGAVSQGKIKSQGEYQEQLEFVGMIRETSAAILETEENPKFELQLDKLATLIRGKADAASVARLARSIQSDIMQIARLDAVPTRWPDLTRGRDLFAQSCVACHGVSGRGDGISGKNLDPSPSNFHDPGMRALSPFQAFNTIRLGVPGTGMAAFDSLSDQEVWDLAFYVVSFRHQNSVGANRRSQKNFDDALLREAATLSDEQLEERHSEEEKEIVGVIRTHSGGDSSGGSLLTARNHLESAQRSYDAGDFDSARSYALRAYLEGIEPIEPRLRANDSEAVYVTENFMAEVRGAIEEKQPNATVRLHIDNAIRQISKIEGILRDKQMSPWLAFMAAFAIFLREGFEAVLIVVTLLGILRAADARRAAVWVHGGWATALLAGGMAWIFSGWVIYFSGAGREILEGVTSLFAVLVLLLVGFWLHSQTEIGRWRTFIQIKIKKSLEGEKLFALALMSFIAVFREAFETVLFLRAIWIEGAENSRLALGLGSGSALLLIFVLAWMMIKYSSRIPIRKLFTLSSSLMAVLAIVLTGKGLHSLQESGALSITSAPINFRIDLIGLYPTLETVASQTLVLAVIAGLWFLGSRPTSKLVPAKG